MKNANNLSGADLERLIMVELSAAGHYVEKYTGGLFYTKDGRPMKVGINGRADLGGFRAGDQRAFFIEVKGRDKNGRVDRKRGDQVAFVAAMQKRGALAGFAYSVQDAFDIINEVMRK